MLTNMCDLSMTGFAWNGSRHIAKKRCVSSSPQAFETAILFTLYELAGVVTNLAAGAMGARWGIRSTLLTGLFLQVLGIGMLMGWQVSVPPSAGRCYWMSQSPLTPFLAVLISWITTHGCTGSMGCKP